MPDTLQHGMQQPGPATVAPPGTGESQEGD